MAEHHTRRVAIESWHAMPGRALDRYMTYFSRARAITTRLDSPPHQGREPTPELSCFEKCPCHARFIRLYADACAHASPMQQHATFAYMSAPCIEFIQFIQGLRTTYCHIFYLRFHLSKMDALVFLLPSRPHAIVQIQSAGAAEYAIITRRAHSIGPFHFLLALFSFYQVAATLFAAVLYRVRRHCSALSTTIFIDSGMLLALQGAGGDIVSTWL